MTDKETTLAEIIKNKVLQSPYHEDSFDTSTDKWLFDFRSIILIPQYLQLITDLLFAKIQHYPRIQICGLESAAIPLITALVNKAHAEGRIANGFYIRKSRKKSGMYRLIEGVVNDDPIIIVDDVINKGESKFHILACLEQVGKKADAILTIIKYSTDKDYSIFIDNNVQIYSIYTLDDFNLTLPQHEQTSYNQYKIIPLYQPKIYSHRHVVQKSIPVLARDGTIYFGTDEGIFIALTPEGQELWCFKTGKHFQGKSIFSSPTIYQDAVIFGSYDGSCYCLNRHDGSVIWVNREADFIGSSPTYSDRHQIIYIGFEFGLEGQQGSLAALNSLTGELLWENKTAAFTHASPLYVEELDIVYCGGNEGVMSAYKAASGELLWRFVTEGGAMYTFPAGYSRGDIKSKPVYDHETNSLAFCSMDGWMYVLDAKTGALRFKHHTDYHDTSLRCGIYGYPVYHNNLILFAGLDKTLYCLSKLDGVLIWSRQLGGRIFSSPVVIRKNVYIGTNDGCLYEINVLDGTISGRIYFGERITNPAVYTGDCLLVTTNGNRMYKILIDETTLGF